MNRVWILTALVVACRAGVPARSTTPAAPTPPAATPPRPAAPVAVAPDDAVAPPSPPREDDPFAAVSRYYLREGAFPTREQTFRPGLTLDGAFEGDVEGDGSHAQLVTLSIPYDGESTPDGVPPRALAYLRRTAAGWRSELFPGSFNDAYWRPPIVLMGRPVLVVEQYNDTPSEHDDADGDGVEEFYPGGTTYYYSLASRNDDGRWFVLVHDVHTSERYEHFEFAGLPDASLLVTSVDGRGRRRWRVLQTDWTDRRVTAPDSGNDDAWSRRAPPASVPRPRVTQMVGVVCHAVIDAPFRLRRTATAAPTGALYRAHTYVTLLSLPGVARGDARLFRVRVANAHDDSGPEGFAYVRGREVWDSCPLP